MLNVNENSEMVPQIENFKKKLYPYQLASIKMIEDLESKNFSITKENINYKIKTEICIFSNPVGSGKTLTILGLISRNAHKNNLEDYLTQENVIFSHRSNNTITATYSSFRSEEEKVSFSDSLTNKSLIVCPSNIFSQWESEIKTTNLKCLHLKSSSQVEKFTKEFTEGDYDIVLCSSTMYNKLCSYTDKILWNRVIIDEASSIKAINKACFSKFFILTTATPEVFSYSRTNNFILKTLLKKFVSSYEQNYSHFINVRCNDEYILAHNSYEREEFFIECKSPLALRILGNSLNSDITSLINSGNLEEAIKRLGGDVTKSTDLVETYTSKLTIDIEDLYAEKRYIYEITNISETSRKNKIESLDKKINSLATQMGSIQKRIEEVNTDTCVVCFSNYENPVLIKCCKNILCFNCLSGCLKNKQKCPYCRTAMDYSSTILLSENNTEDKQDEPILKEKLENLIEIAMKNKNKKILLFSNSDFEEIRNVFSEKKIDYKEVIGGRENTDRIIKNYKNTDSSTNLLFLNVKNMGSGINLENTDIVIFYSKMNDSLRTQVIGRALRISRKKDHKLQIYNLCHNNEMSN